MRFTLIARKQNIAFNVERSFGLIGVSPPDRGVISWLYEMRRNSSNRFWQDRRLSKHSNVYSLSDGDRFLISS